MSWLDKIKGAISSKKVENKSENQKREITFEEIPKILKEKSENINKKESEIKQKIFDNISRTEETLSQGIGKLNNVDLNKRKEQEKLKLIVKENANLYSSMASRLNSRLKEVNNNKKYKEKTELRDFLNKITSALNEFYQSSNIPFQKGTILIGQEMADLKNTIKEFSDGLVSIEKDNEYFFKEYDSLGIIKTNLEEYDILEKQIKLLIKSLEEQKNELDEKTKNDSNLTEEIEKIKNSETYEKDMIEKSKSTKEIKNKIDKLKTGINFKDLNKKYHSIEEKHEIVKKYASNFTQALIEDKDLDLENILEDENQRNLLSEIRYDLMESNNGNVTDSERKIKSLEEKQNKLDSEINTINLEIDLLSKKLEKMNAKQDKTKEETKLLVEKII